MRLMFAYAGILAAAMSVAGCMSDDDRVDHHTGQQQTEPLITNTPSPAMDQSRNGSNLTGAADPNVGIVSPDGPPGNTGGR